MIESQSYQSDSAELAFVLVLDDVIHLVLAKMTALDY